MRQTLAAFAALTFLLGYGVVGVKAGASDRYPNEILGFQLYKGAKWASLTPLKSRMADVRQVLGPPDDAHDLANYSQPYPGDGTAKCAVWDYSDGDWTILVYFDSYTFADRSQPLPEDQDLVSTIDLIPRTPIPFHFKYIPPTFESMPVDAPCARWIEYRDTYGLKYEVFTSKTAYGDEQPGDLNRIVYGPSDAEISEYKMRHPKTRSN